MIKPKRLATVIITFIDGSILSFSNVSAVRHQPNGLVTIVEAHDQGFHWGSFRATAISHVEEHWGL